MHNGRFTRTLGAGLLGLLLWTGTALAATEHTFIYVGPDDSSARYGVLQGLKEANHQGQFLDVEFHLTEVSAHDYDPAVAADATAVFVDADSKTFSRIVETTSGLAVINLTSPDNKLRRNCTDNGLHVIPSQRMLDDAEAQWRQKHPDSSATAQTWHPQFRKYAAKDLSDRFRKEEGQGRDMDDAAWAGWAGVRLVTDTITRQKLHEPQALLQYMKSDLLFDGQKGIDMHFRETGQLRQILLLNEGGKIVGEAPVRGVADTSDLDSLGITRCD